MGFLRRQVMAEVEDAVLRWSKQYRSCWNNAVQSLCLSSSTCTQDRTTVFTIPFVAKERWMQGLGSWKPNRAHAPRIISKATARVLRHCLSVHLLLLLIHISVDAL